MADRIGEDERRITSARAILKSWRGAPDRKRRGRDNSLEGRSYINCTDNESAI